MSALLSPARKTEPNAIAANSVIDGSVVDRPRRRLIVGALLFVATLATLAIGGWGLVTSVGSQAPPASIGDAVDVSGGSLRVDDVTPEHMAPMRLKSFGKAGMNMTGTSGMDMAPEGFRRFSVDVTLLAENGDLKYSPKDFRINGEGTKETAPVRNALTGETIPAGNATSGVLVFQVPDEAKNLMLTFDGSRQPVALDLPEDDGHSHEH